MIATRLVQPFKLAALFCCFLLVSCTERSGAVHKPDIEVANGFNEMTKSVSYSDAVRHLERLQYAETQDLRTQALKLRWGGTVSFILAIQDHPDPNFPNFIEKNLQRISANTPIEIRKSDDWEDIVSKQSGVRVFFIADRGQLEPYRSLIETGEPESATKIEALGCSMEQWISTDMDGQYGAMRNIIFLLDPKFPDPEMLKAPHYALRRVENDNMRNMFWQRRCLVWALMNSMGLAVSSPDQPTEISTAYQMGGAESAMTKYDLAALKLFYATNE